MAGRSEFKQKKNAELEGRIFLDAEASVSTLPWKQAPVSP